MRRFIMTLGTLCLFATGVSADPVSGQTGRRAADRLKTYANPIDLPYRFQSPDMPPVAQTPVAFREAADPTMVVFKGEYWLFPSHSLGYWRSKDLLHWSFVKASGYAVDKYAPTVVAIGGRLYMAVSEGVRTLWTTDDPASGRWVAAAQLDHGYQDPCLFLDDDGRLYMYDGLHPLAPLNVEELDPKTFHVLRAAKIPESRNKEARGWEVPGDRNEKVKDFSFVEGSWLTKRDGRYYLEYSAPGTQFKTYANGMLVADDPMGPFRYQPYSPFALKSTGFITGAGHGSTFKDLDGRWWHVGTMTISRRHIFERRLGLFPVSFMPGGEILADTYLGDYPHYIDGDRGLVGWMLLSRHASATASSSLDGFAPENAADEDVRTSWSAKTGAAGEWLTLDLGAPKDVDAIQVNLADQDAAAIGIGTDVYRYVVEASLDGTAWHVVVPASHSGRDAPHAYHVLPRTTKARYLKISNLHTPDGAKFSLYDLRIFGKAAVPLPAAVSDTRGKRDAADARRALIDWKPAAGADFYIVRVGTRPDLMNQNYQVYADAHSLDLGSLTVGVDYVFAVDSVNERGITRGTTIGHVD